MNIVLDRHVAQLATKLKTLRASACICAYRFPNTSHTRYFSQFRPRMANLNVEIPSLKLNDGTSIPLVSPWQSYICIQLTDGGRLAMGVGLSASCIRVEPLRYMNGQVLTGATRVTAGTAWYKSNADGGIDRKLIDATKAAIKLGYYHLDGAEIYNTEEEIGIAIQESKVPREKLFVTTKVITNIKDIPNAINMSLKKLQLDYVDLSVALCLIIRT